MRDNLRVAQQPDSQLGALKGSQPRNFSLLTSPVVQDRGSWHCQFPRQRLDLVRSFTSAPQCYPKKAGARKNQTWVGYFTHCSVSIGFTRACFSQRRAEGLARHSCPWPLIHADIRRSEGRFMAQNSRSGSLAIDSETSLQSRSNAVIEPPSTVAGRISRTSCSHNLASYFTFLKYSRQFGENSAG